MRWAPSKSRSTPSASRAECSSSRRDALHVKLLQAVPPDRLRLISKNEAFEPVDVAMADVDVVGRVVWKGGRF